MFRFSRDLELQSSTWCIRGVVPPSEGSFLIHANFPEGIADSCSWVLSSSGVGVTRFQHHAVAISSCCCCKMPGLGVISMSTGC